MKTPKVVDSTLPPPRIAHCNVKKKFVETFLISKTETFLSGQHDTDLGYHRSTWLSIDGMEPKVNLGFRLVVIFCATF